MDSEFVELARSVEFVKSLIDSEALSKKPNHRFGC